MRFICGFSNLAKYAGKYADYAAHIIDMSGHGYRVISYTV